MCAGDTPVASLFISARNALLELQGCTAKHNACIRARFPLSHPVYKQVEKAFFGAFDDTPMPIHVFSHAAENAAILCGAPLPMHPQDLYAVGNEEVISAAYTGIGLPARTARGGINWRRSLSHVERHLADRIEHHARIFFDSVYCLPHINKRLLSPEEAAFWKRYRQLLAAHARAKTDTDPLYAIVWAIGHILPQPLCWQVVQFL